MKVAVQGREAYAYAYTGGKAFDAALPCIVFVHGALNDHSVWNLLARWFAHHGHGVLAVDLPGHGSSAGPALDSVEAMADWVLALLDAAGVQRAAIAGHSMGSLVALEVAARAPGRITQLAMLATAYPMKVSDALLATARAQPHKAIDMVNAFSLSTTAAKPSFPGPGMWLHGLNRALMRRLQAQAKSQARSKSQAQAQAPSQAQSQDQAQQPGGFNLFAHDFAVCDRYANGLQAAALVQCPATLLLGARDQMTSPKATASVAAALRARVVTVPAGHALMSEAPDAMLQALRVAFAGHPPMAA